MTDHPNTLRCIIAPGDAIIFNNYPGRYSTDGWTGRYWAVTE